METIVYVFTQRVSHALTIELSISSFHCMILLCVKLIVFFSESQVTEPNSAKLGLVCTKTEPYSQITTVTLRLLFSKDDTHHLYKNVSCDGKDKHVEFSHLSENTRYTIQSVWETENTTHYCQVMEFYTRK